MIKDESKKGALLSYIIIALNTVTGLVYTPFMLRQLGQSEYGLYMLIGSLVGYISILDFGLHNTVYRYIAKYQAEKDKDGEENFLASTFIFYGIITILVLIVGGILYFNIENIFSNSLSSQEVLKARKMFAILIFNLAISLPLGAFQFIIRGYGRFIYANFVSILRIILRTLVLVGILLLGYKSVAIVVVDTIFNIGMGIAYAFFCFKILSIKIKLHSFNRGFIKEIFNYSVYVFILAIVNQFFWKLGHLVLGIIASSAAVGVYALATNLVMYYQQLSLGISGVFLPKISKIIANGGNEEDLTDLMIKVGRIQLSILGLVLVGFLLLGRDFIQLWAGNGYDDVFWIAIMIFIAQTIPLVQTIGGTILQVKNMQSFKAKSYLVMCLLNIVGSVILGRRFGAIGVGIATALSVIVFQVVVLNYYYRYKVRLNVKRFYLEISDGIIQTIFISLVVGSTTFLFQWNGWLILFSKILFITILYTLLLFKIGLKEYEKNLFIYPIMKKINFK